MMTPAEKAERREHALALLAERGLALACDLQEAALAATDLDEKARMASAFGKVSRAVRQTFFLDARLDRDLVRQNQEARAEAMREDQDRREDRRAHVKKVVERAIWAEHEFFEAERLIDELTELLDEEASAPDFADDLPAAHVARISAKLGLKGRNVSPISPERENAGATETSGLDAAPRRRSSA